MRDTKGITLVGLVVTIIILLILAGVSIAMLTGDNGLLTKAENAKAQTEIAEVKERVKTDILGEQAGNSGELTKSKFIEILNKYFEGVPTEEDLPEDLATLTLKTKAEYGSHDIKISEIYNGSFQNDSNSNTVANLKVGEKVYYDTGNPNVGNQGIIECTVLYDKAYDRANGTNYGIQIISSDVLKDAGGEPLNFFIGSNDFERAKNSYNNALKLLYEKAQQYLNASFAKGARIVGSDPGNPDWDVTNDEAGNYTISDTVDWYDLYKDRYDGSLKNEDDKYLLDWEQLSRVPGLAGASSKYWLASRGMDLSVAMAHFGFGVRYGNPSELRTLYICAYYSSYDPVFTGRDIGYEQYGGLRPVFILNSGIKIENGDGDTTPYTLAP